ncbi:beta-N-acetylhexosaminidase [Sporolactobacillus sp. Y61]|uniref:Beta-N-acetylhexosaminidase n=1 Tax=Sporolactobacillus sp. Y61 TaxID=3160863 RepID=A0AAU8IH73_9BACL
MNHRLMKIISGVFLALFLLGLSLFFLINGNPSKETQHNAAASPGKASSSKKQGSDQLIDRIFTLADKGQTLHIPFTAGKTGIEDVRGAWGSPDSSTKTDHGQYEDYPDRNGVIVHQNQSVYDIRSYDPQVRSLRISQIKKSKGHPDEVKFFKHEGADQVILIYHLQGRVDLKWVAPRPTDRQSDPHIDYLSVYTDPNRLIDPERPEAILSKMSLDEKIGQMIIAGVSGTSLDAKTRGLIRQNKIGGFIFYAPNLVNPDQSVKLLNQIKKENEGNRLPLLLSLDQEGGRVERLPGLENTLAALRIGATGQPQLARQNASIIGLADKSFGFNLDFAPVVDVNSNPDNPVIGDRSFSSDPQTAAAFGTQAVKGLMDQKVIPVIKHFPGHGDTSVDSHLALPVVNKNMSELKQLELIPFEQAIKDGADVVMVAHILLPKLDKTYPASMSDRVMTDLLRNQLHFNGVIVTDDMTMKAITNQYSLGPAAVQSVKAGADLVLVGHDYTQAREAISAIKAAVQNGEISEERLNASVTRIIKLKKKYQLTDEMTGNVPLDELNREIRDFNRNLKH